MAKGTTKKAATKVATKKVAAKKVAAKKTVEKAPAKKVVEKAPAPAPVKKVAAKKVAAKKAPAKKAAVKKVAPKKAAAKKAAKALTTIVARIDVGFGNSLYLRGSGAGLSWEKGIVMGCATSDEWVWSSDDVTSPLEFKVLVNDESWADGANAIVAPGERVVIEPEF